MLVSNPAREALLGHVSLPQNKHDRFPHNELSVREHLLTFVACNFVDFFLIFGSSTGAEELQVNQTLHMKQKQKG